MGAGLVLHMVLNLVLSIDGRCSSQSVSLFAFVIKHMPLFNQDVPACACTTDCIQLSFAFRAECNLLVSSHLHSELTKQNLSLNHADMALSCCAA